MQTWIKANIGKLIERFGGMKLQLITDDEYAALEDKDPETLYIVVYSESDIVELYLGDKKISDTIIPKTITENGTYDASDDDADGYNPVTVDIPIVSKTITENGTYNASSDSAAGYDPVTVNVPQPTITTTTAAADLTGYEAGDTDLGNDWEIVLGATGTAAVGSETVSGVTYEGLEIGGSTTIAKAGGLTGGYQVLEIEIIETSLTYDSSYGTVRVITTGGTGYEGSLYISSSSDYLHLITTAASWKASTLVDIDSTNAYDTAVTKTDIMDKVLNVKYVCSNEEVTLYINDVPKLMWDAFDFSAALRAYGIHVGASGIGENGMLITKAEYRGASLSYDGRTWAPI